MINSIVSLSSTTYNELLPVQSISQKHLLLTDIFKQIQWHTILDNDYINRNEFNILKSYHDNKDDYFIDELSIIIMKLLDNANHNLLMIKYICALLEILFGLEINNNIIDYNNNDKNDNNSINNYDNNIGSTLNDMSIHGYNNNNNDAIKENDYNNNMKNISKQNILAFKNNDFINNLITILNISDHHIQYITSLLLSSIYNIYKYSTIDRVIIWISNKFISEFNNNTEHQQQQQQQWEISLSCLLQLVHHHEIRFMLLHDNAVIYIMKILKSLGKQTATQQIYELLFVLWTLSLTLTEDSSSTSTYPSLSTSTSTSLSTVVQNNNSSNNTNNNSISHDNNNNNVDYNNNRDIYISMFISSNIITIINDFILTLSSKKILRMSIAIMKNLCLTNNDDVLNEIYTVGLYKTIEILNHNNQHNSVNNKNNTSTKNHNSNNIMYDEDVENDMKTILDILKRNYRELSSYERWITQINSGNLSWGILHTDKFWKENAKYLEYDNFRELKTLLSLLHSTDPNIICIALYDIGEFSRFYPNGRVIVSKLGGKETIMTMMSHENNEIQRHTLQCISKLLVTNWEFLR